MTMTYNEAIDRAHRIWPGLVQSVERNVDENWAVILKKPDRLGYSTHLLDGNGHTECHRHCAAIEGQLDMPALPPGSAWATPPAPPSVRLDANDEDLTASIVTAAAWAAFAPRGGELTVQDTIKVCAALITFLNAAEVARPRTFNQWRMAIENLRVNLGGPTRMHK
jgi:hypothetical protein